MAKGGYQKRRIAEKKRQEREARRRAQRNRKILTGTVVALVLAMIGGVTFVALTGTEGDLTASPSVSPSLSTSATPSPEPSATFAKPCTKRADVKKGQKTFEHPPCKIIDEQARYTATMQTSKGTIVAELFAADAPVTVNNFVFLSRVGFYDGSIFHRVIPDFGGPGSNMVQGGDAVNRNGTGDPGYSFGDENLIPFGSPGFLAMANSGPGTNGSQFFLLDGTVEHLNKLGSCPGPSGCHSNFGRVIKGLAVIDKIASVKRGPSDEPETDVVLRRVTIKETKR